jgi:hypothetical protein
VVRARDGKRQQQLHDFIVGQTVEPAFRESFAKSLPVTVVMWSFN